MKSNEFKPEFFCGEWVQVNSNDKFDIAFKFIDKKMKSVVPIEYQKQVKIIIKELGDIGTEDAIRPYGSVGWKHIPHGIPMGWANDIDEPIRVF